MMLVLDLSSLHWLVSMAAALVVQPPPCVCVCVCRVLLSVLLLI